MAALNHRRIEIVKSFRITNKSAVVFMKLATKTAIVCVWKADNVATWINIVVMRPNNQMKGNF
jgi:hypothetical protein